jgi:ATP-binding cassette subfamily G (WHITE) protein 2 (PDR)
MCTELRGEGVYTAELDVHFPELTVEQTLDFAVQSRLTRMPLPGMSHSQEASWYREALIAMLGLQSARSTKLGNDLIRGVSGGERKRVSLGEALACWSALHCWDNSTRGLDSATALAFVQIVRQYTTTIESATIMTMYQASDAIYETFDKVTLLYQGQQIYFGSCDEAREYFTELGFQCPHNATMPDFLTSLTHPVEARLLIRPGHEHSVPSTARAFRQAWLESRPRQRLLAEMQEYESKYPANGPHAQTFKHAVQSEKSSM